MNPQEIAKLLLRRMNGLSWSDSLHGVTMGGITSMLQRDINQALGAWQASGDTTGLRQVATTMHSYGSLTDAELERITGALDGATQ